jgi:hypothetical protein
VREHKANNHVKRAMLWLLNEMYCRFPAALADLVDMSLFASICDIEQEFEFDIKLEFSLLAAVPVTVELRKFLKAIVQPEVIVAIIELLEDEQLDFLFCAIARAMQSERIVREVYFDAGIVAAVAEFFPWTEHEGKAVAELMSLPASEDLICWRYSQMFQR